MLNQGLYEQAVNREISDELSMVFWLWWKSKDIITNWSD